MTNIDPTFPIFCLTLALVDGDAYAKRIVPAFVEFKIKYFGHEGVILHSSDIRKSRGDFNILLNKSTRTEFMSDLSDLMAMPDYELVTVAIDKAAHASKYVSPIDPYNLALEFALERLCEWVEVRGEDKVHVLAEARTSNQDNELAAEYLRVISSGTSFVRKSKFAAIQMPFRTAKKSSNLIGHQIADMAAYATARFAANRQTTYAPWAIVRERIFKGKRGTRYGLKLFP